jgi:hypothetical protein
MYTNGQPMPDSEQLLRRRKLTLRLNSMFIQDYVTYVPWGSRNPLMLLKLEIGPPCTT